MWFGIVAFSIVVGGYFPCSVFRVFPTEAKTLLGFYFVFADDTKIFREIKTFGDATALQEDLGKLATWSQSSGLLFNEAKCKAQHITRKTKPILSSYKLNNTALERSFSRKRSGRLD